MVSQRARTVLGAGLAADWLAMLGSGTQFLAAGVGGDRGSRQGEASALFVRIRGYTAWAKPRGTADRFSTANRHAEGISWIVTRFGGSLV